MEDQILSQRLEFPDDDDFNGRLDALMNQPELNPSTPPELVASQAEAPSQAPDPHDQPAERKASNVEDSYSITAVAANHSDSLVELEPLPPNTPVDKQHEGASGMELPISAPSLDQPLLMGNAGKDRVFFNQSVKGPMLLKL